MSGPSPVQIREANAHLAAVHRRAAELEARLGAAERTVREQAESLIRKDEQLRGALRELGRAKDREIADLQEKLFSSEGTVQKLLSVIQEKDALIVQLKHRSELLHKICQRRPLLDSLLAYMAEGEQLGPLARAGPPSASSSPLPDGTPETDGPACPLSNSQAFSLSEDENKNKKTCGSSTTFPLLPVPVSSLDSDSYFENSAIPRGSRETPRGIRSFLF